MKRWSFYDATGHFTGKTFAGPERALEGNTPSGCRAIEGIFDPLSQRVDLETGEVVDYQPPQPSADHEWNAERKRWVLSAAAAERETRRAAARMRIAELEAAQPRAIREHALGYDGARDRLQAIDDEIASLRPLLSGQTAASGTR